MTELSEHTGAFPKTSSTVDPDSPAASKPFVSSSLKSIRIHRDTVSKLVGLNASGMPMSFRPPCSWPLLVAAAIADMLSIRKVVMSVVRRS